MKLTGAFGARSLSPALGGARSKAAMLVEDLLLTLAEIAVTLVGFSALVVVFRGTPDNPLDDADRFRVRMLIQCGLAGAFFAVLPHTLASFGLSEASTWRAASGIMALAGVSVPIFSVRRAIALKIRFLPPDVVIVVAGASVTLVLALNFLGIAFPGTAGPYVLGVIWTLVLAAYFFLLITAGRRG